MHFWPTFLKSQNKLSYPGHNCYQVYTSQYFSRFFHKNKFLTKRNDLLVLGIYFHLLKRESSQQSG